MKDDVEMLVPATNPPLKWPPAKQSEQSTRPGPASPQHSGQRQAPLSFGSVPQLQRSPSDPTALPQRRLFVGTTPDTPTHPGQSQPTQSLLVAQTTASSEPPPATSQEGPPDSRRGQATGGTSTSPQTSVTTPWSQHFRERCPWLQGVPEPQREESRPPQTPPQPREEPLLLSSLDQFQHQPSAPSGPGQGHGLCSTAWTHAARNLPSGTPRCSLTKERL